MRQIALDTESTGLDLASGHRLIEIGAIELVDRRLSGQRFHRRLQPDRAIDEGALQVHGIRAEDLVDQPRFGDIAAEFLRFIEEAELIVHNAEFDIAFLDHELGLLGGALGQRRIRDRCTVLDTLPLARRMHPGQRNSLDALCKRYQVDNSGRRLHSALLDAELLAEVYLAMTGGQVTLDLMSSQRPVHTARGPDSNRARGGGCVSCGPARRSSKRIAAASRPSTRRAAGPVCGSAWKKCRRA